MISLRFLSLFIAQPNWIKENLFAFPIVYIDNISMSSRQTYTHHNNRIWSALIVLHREWQRERELIEYYLVGPHSRKWPSRIAETPVHDEYTSSKTFKASCLKGMRFYKIYTCFMVVKIIKITNYSEIASKV